MGISPNVGKVDAESSKRYVNLETIKKTLLSAEGSTFSKVSNTPPNNCVDTSLSHNSSSFVSKTTETEAVYAIFTRHGGVRNFRRIGK